MSKRNYAVLFSIIIIVLALLFYFVIQRKASNSHVAYVPDITATADNDQPDVIHPIENFGPSSTEIVGGWPPAVTVSDSPYTCPMFKNSRSQETEVMVYGKPYCVAINILKEYLPPQGDLSVTPIIYRYSTPNSDGGIKNTTFTVNYSDCSPFDQEQGNGLETCSSSNQIVSTNLNTTVAKLMMK